MKLSRMQWALAAWAAMVAVGLVACSGNDEAVQVTASEVRSAT